MLIDNPETSVPVATPVDPVITAGIETADVITTPVDPEATETLGTLDGTRRRRLAFPL